MIATIVPNSMLMAELELTAQIECGVSEQWWALKS